MVIGNCFEPNLWGKFQASGLPALRVLHDKSKHSCNGAYLFAEKEGLILDQNHFDQLVRDLQKTYLQAFELSRRGGY